MPNLIDLSGQRFGRLTVLNRAPNHGKVVMWHCKCDCGVEKDVRGNLLRSGKTQSCGCFHKEQLAERSTPDLIGQKFNRLLVLEKTDKRRDGKVIWKCQCDCGNICYVTTKHLHSGEVKSCGCLKKENQQLFGQKNIKDISGQRFGKLVAIRPILNIPTTSGGRLWECKCDCGNIIQTRLHNLTDGSTQSCGCIQSHGEGKILQILQENNINFERQKKFKDCLNPLTNNSLFFDFYLPDYNLLIEYDGEQHFYSNNRGWNNEKNLNETRFRDEVKNKWCLSNNIKLIRIPYTEYNNINLKMILGEEKNELST